MLPGDEILGRVTADGVEVARPVRVQRLVFANQYQVSQTLMNPPP